jgi:alpha-glucoside transport system permease protein
VLFGAAILADTTLTDSISKFGGVLAAVAVFFAILLIVFFAAGRAAGRLTRPATIAAFLGPAVLLILIGLVLPAIRTVFLSFLNDDSTRVVGGANYGWAFTTDSIHQVLLNTLGWIIVAPVLATVLGLSMALLVDRLRRQAVYKSLIFMPMAISFVGASIIWRFVYEAHDPSLPQIGLLSQIAIWIGFKNPPNWILEHPLNNVLLMVIMIWVQTGFAMVVLSAAIKAIPTEILEAVRIDGARAGQVFYYVTIPMIRNTLVVVLTTVMIATLKIFDIVRTMTGGNFGTQVLANEMYSQSFVQFNVGRGSALAVILFVAVLPLVGYNIYQLRRDQGSR